uniref:Uncharacterized protein n=1 Tax=Vitis vinifera TaxID=29760 RepID=A5BXM9_VITVI|nr:hypothetical protein VITISV_034779 [Vitis vinifera]
MAISKTLIASLLISLLVYQITEAIAGEHAVRGVGCRRGQICATGHVGLAALVATASLQARLVTKRSAPATPT